MLFGPTPFRSVLDRSCGLAQLGPGTVLASLLAGPRTTEAFTVSFRNLKGLNTHRMYVPGQRLPVHSLIAAS